MAKGDGYSAPLGSTIRSATAPAGEAEVPAEVPAEVAPAESVEPVHSGGGWYAYYDSDGNQQKIQGREAAYEAAGVPLPDDEE